MKVLFTLFLIGIALMIGIKILAFAIGAVLVIGAFLLPILGWVAVVMLFVLLIKGIATLIESF